LQVGLACLSTRFVEQKGDKYGFLPRGRLCIRWVWTVQWETTGGFSTPQRYDVETPPPPMRINDRIRRTLKRMREDLDDLLT
jgi:hypothetical protein